MDQWVLDLLLVSFTLLLLTCCAVFWYIKTHDNNPAALLLYNTADSYSNLESEVRFNNSKNAKIWIGQVGLSNVIAKQKSQLLEQQKEAYTAAMKVAKNWCNLSNLKDPQHVRKIADELPCIGHRQLSKFYHPIYDEKYGSHQSDDKRLLVYHYDTAHLAALNAAILQDVDSSDLRIRMGQCRVVDFSDAEQYRAFRLILETIQHPYMAKVEQVAQSQDKRHVFVVRDLFKQGSLRDHIHQCELSRSYGDKYSTPGKPLHMNRVRKYGRQVLEAMSYVSACGLVNYQLHSGNVLITHNDDAQLSEMENLFMAFPLRHPLHQHLCAVKKIYRDLDVEMCLFGYVLFEMATGYECPTPSPLDCLHEIPVRLDANIISILGRIFGDKSLGPAPSIDDLKCDPFFAATHLPPCGDVSLFVALKNENEMVNRMRNVVLMQCYYTYSAEMLVPDKQRAVVSAKKKINTKKRRKKKKKRKGSYTGSRAQSCLSESVAYHDAAVTDEKEEEIYMDCMDDAKDRESERVEQGQYHTVKKKKEYVSDIDSEDDVLWSSM